jgi:hypothetical protein
MTATKSRKIEIENVMSPGHIVRVDADKYEAMKRAFLKVLPKKSPGLTATEIGEAILLHLPDDLFPQGAKAGWRRKRCSSTWKRKASLRGKTPSRCAGTSVDLFTGLERRNSLAPAG